ncbi:MAG: asparagine synthase (glutamine-hydrolyzing) [Bryobacteraceae bacterium]
MCGILGAVGDFPSLTAPAVRRARDLMIHRGPDDDGLSHHGPAWLAFRRLAILDLSPAGAQPMSSADGSVTLVFNGEIYNYRDLRRELEQRLPFRSSGDTEVLLNGYLAWGWEQLLQRIDGMFAFAVWDSRKRMLFGARDRVGKKPFFYRHTREGVLFSSTIHSLLALLDTAPAVNPEAVDAYLTYQAVPAPLTMYEGVAQLPPAHEFRFQLDSGQLTLGRYWKVKFEPKNNCTEDEAIDEVERLTRAAVRRRMISDVPLGAFLSGGVDSSLVVAMMAQETSSPVEAVVIGFDDPAFDERRHARAVASQYGVRLHEAVWRPDGVADLPEILWHYGQPMADVSVLPTFEVSRQARSHVTVVLNGDGGDELFAGYARPVLASLRSQYTRLVPQAARNWLQGAFPRGASGLVRRAAMLAKAGALDAASAFTYDRAFGDWRHQAYSERLLSRVAHWHPDEMYRRAWDDSTGLDDVDRVLDLDFTSYLPDQLLTKMDVATMAHGLEARSPLLDTALVEFAASLPSSMKVRSYRTKHLLKRVASRYVPGDLVYRRKRGFVIPVAQWLRAEIRPHVKAVFESRTFLEREWIRPDWITAKLDEHCSGARDWSQLLWTAFVLEVWARLSIDRSLERSSTLDELRLGSTDVARPAFRTAVASS